MRLTPRLILPTLLALSLATCKGGDDTPLTGPEDCFTQGDEEQDGLADCADDDCLDGCLEDCIDTVDNDADGAIDCDDDECQGAAGCGSRFNLEARITSGEIRFLWGPGMDNFVGVPVSGVFTGSLEIDGTPLNSPDPSFSCYGLINGYSSAVKLGYGSLEYVGGDCDGCDFRFQMTTTVENGGLNWSRDCPVTELPVAEFGFFMDRYEVTRYDPSTGTWALQYSSNTGNQYTVDYGYGLIYVFYMERNTQLNPVVWEASL